MHHIFTVASLSLWAIRRTSKKILDGAIVQYSETITATLTIQDINFAGLRLIGSS